MNGFYHIVYVIQKKRFLTLRRDEQTVRDSEMDSSFACMHFVGYFNS